MSNIIKWEIRKILQKKSLYIMLIVILIITFAYFYFFDFRYDETRIDYKNNKLSAAQGMDAVEERKELAGKFDGVLTDEKVKDMETYVKSAEGKLDNLSSDQKAIVKNHFRDQIAILNYLELQNEKQKTNSLSETFNKSLILGYHDGWKKIISSMESVGMIFIALLSSILFSGTFTDENSVFMDSIICSSQFGKNKVVTAKITATIIVGLGAFALNVIYNLILYGSTYSLAGFNVSIQASSQFTESQYFISFGQFFLVTLLCNALGLCCSICITVFCSACSKNTVTALVLSLLINFFPIFFDFTDSVPALQKMLELLPVYMLHTSGIFKETNFYFGLKQPFIMIIISILITAIMIFFTRKIYKHHQG